MLAPPADPSPAATFSFSRSTMRSSTMHGRFCSAVRTCAQPLVSSGMAAACSSAAWASSCGSSSSSSPCPPPPSPSPLHATPPPSPAPPSNNGWLRTPARAACAPPLPLPPSTVGGGAGVGGAGLGERTSASRSCGCADSCLPLDPSGEVGPAEPGPGPPAAPPSTLSRRDSSRCMSSGIWVAGAPPGCPVSASRMAVYTSCTRIMPS
mmetsp:Transcript_3477/g.8675  ORF Transcript_3477/g.8675 Transcript_3477/m.8675 type:complete len:208 (-) Transcript_3477:733-1356(-)